MSSQKGNTSRSRPQKHQNSKVYKNNLHDTSKRTKVINNITITNVCDRCKSVLEWKIKYKKYKLLKNPSTCCKCNTKSVKEPYHTVCQPCSAKLNVCPKCVKAKETTSQAGNTNDVSDLEAAKSNSDVHDDDDDSDFNEDDDSLSYSDS